MPYNRPTPLWLRRHVTNVLADAHDTDPERETYAPARLSDPALRAAFDAAAASRRRSRQRLFDITDFGAERGVFLTGASMTAGSAVLTTPGHTFAQTDVGKVIGVRGAVQASTDYNTLANDGVLVTSIASVSGGVATLAAPAAISTGAFTGWGGGQVVFGAPIDAALTAANAAAKAAGGGTVYIPAGTWVGATQVTFSTGVAMSGAGRANSRMYYVHADDGSSYDTTPWLYWKESDPSDSLRHDVNLEDFAVDGRFFVGTAGYSFRAKLLLVDRTLDSYVSRIAVLHSPATAIGYDVSQRCVIEGNTIINAGRFAVANSNRGNSSGSAIGIAVPSDAGGVEATIVIRDNYMSGGWTIGGQPGYGSTGRSGVNIEGIYTSGLPNGAVQTDIAHRGSHLVTGNIVEGFYAGIRDSGALGTRVIANDVRRCQIGILCGSKGSGTDSRIPLGTIILGNVVREGVKLNLSTNAAASASGVEVNTTGGVTNPATSGRIRIAENDISGIPGPGVLISGTSGGVDVVALEHNTIRACGSYGIRVVGTVNWLAIVHNIVSGNGTLIGGVTGNHAISVHNAVVWTGGRIQDNDLFDLKATPTQNSIVNLESGATLTGVRRSGNTGDA